MNYAVDHYLGKNALSKIEQSKTIEKTVLAIAQKSDAVNLEQLPEEIFELAQDIFTALNGVSGRTISLQREKLQDQMPRSGVRNRMDDLAVELFGGAPTPPLPKKMTVACAIFDLYIKIVSKENYVRRLNNGEYIDSDGNAERYMKAIEELRHLLLNWLGLDPRSSDY